MAYDITLHPVKESELNKWYFDLDFDKIRKKDYAEVHALAAAYKMPNEALDFYLDAVDAGAVADPGATFENTHGHFAAIVSGCFKPFFYVRNAGLSFLLDHVPEFRGFTKPWDQILNRRFENRTLNQLDRNYSSGVFLPAEQVVRLLEEYNHKGKLYEVINEVFSDGRIAILLKAVNAAIQAGDGLLEASEVVLPNPLNLDETKSYTYILNCDTQGAILFRDQVEQENRAIEEREGLAPGEIARRGEYVTTQITAPKPAGEKKKGFFKKLLG